MARRKGREFECMDYLRPWEASLQLPKEAWQAIKAVATSCGCGYSYPDSPNMRGACAVAESRADWEQDTETRELRDEEGELADEIEEVTEIAINEWEVRRLDRFHSKAQAFLIAAKIPFTSRVQTQDGEISISEGRMSAGGRYCVHSREEEEPTLSYEDLLARLADFDSIEEAKAWAADELESSKASQTLEQACAAWAEKIPDPGGFSELLRKCALLFSKENDARLGPESLQPDTLRAQIAPGISCAKILAEHCAPLLEKNFDSLPSDVQTLFCNAQAKALGPGRYGASRRACLDLGRMYLTAIANALRDGAEGPDIGAFLKIKFPAAARRASPEAAADEEAAWLGLSAQMQDTCALSKPAKRL